MNRWRGTVGFIETKETSPGRWTPDTIERTYRGERVRNTGKFQTSGDINDNRGVSVELSIVRDQFASQHFHSIRYVKLGDVKWKVTNVEDKSPRLILTLGEVYNG